MNKEEVSSPTFSLESVILTEVIYTHEEREVGIVYIQNEFIQIDNPKKLRDQRDIMKIRGKLAQILAEIAL